jgi:putative redox protein
MDVQIDAGEVRLAAHVAEPPVAEPEPPTLVISHGYPTGALTAEATGQSFPALADRIANEGWRVVAFTFRGCGTSTGDFSLGGWLEDLLTIIDRAPTFGDTRGVWLAGFGTGGGLAIAAAARRPAVVGVAAMGAPADFADWARHPRRFLQHARESGLVKHPAFPPSIDHWTRQLRDIRPVDDAALVAPRSMLIVHGSEDESVPSFDARVIGDSHGSAELRIISGAGHDLRNDPRAVAILLGWLDRERHGAR